MTAALGHEVEMESFSQRHTDAEEGAMRGLLDDERVIRPDDEEMLLRSRHHQYRGGKSKTFRVVALSAKALVVIFSCIGLVSCLLLISGRLTTTQSESEFWPYWSRPGNPGEFKGHYPTDVTRDVTPIKCHSHNDYWRSVPLYEAIHYGCTSVEADVWMMDDDDLYVGHSTSSLARERTLRSLYIDPLLEILDRMNVDSDFMTNKASHWRGVFDEDPSQTLVLLIDIKNSPQEVFDTLLAQLEPLRQKGYLSFVDENGLVVKRPLITVGTGETPFERILAYKDRRDIFFDAPLADFANGDLVAQYNVTNSYLASTSMRQLEIDFSEPVDQSKLQMLQAQISGAQKAGLRSRYWDVAEWPVGARDSAWTNMVKLGTDYLSVDDLKAVATEPWGDWSTDIRLAQPNKKRQLSSQPLRKLEERIPPVDLATMFEYVVSSAPYFTGDEKNVLGKWADVGSHFANFPHGLEAEVLEEQNQQESGEPGKDKTKDPKVPAVLQVLNDRLKLILKHHNHVKIQVLILLARLYPLKYESMLDNIKETYPHAYNRAHRDLLFFSPGLEMAFGKLGGALYGFAIEGDPWEYIDKPPNALQAQDGDEHINIAIASQSTSTSKIASTSTSSTAKTSTSTGNTAQATGSDEKTTNSDKPSWMNQNLHGFPTHKLSNNGGGTTQTDNKVDDGAAAQGTAGDPTVPVKPSTGDSQTVAIAHQNQGQNHHQSFPSSFWSSPSKEMWEGEHEGKEQTGYQKPSHIIASSSHKPAAVFLPASQSSEQPGSKQQSETVKLMQETPSRPVPPFLKKPTVSILDEIYDGTIYSIGNQEKPPSAASTGQNTGSQSSGSHKQFQGATDSDPHTIAGGQQASHSLNQLQPGAKPEKPVNSYQPPRPGGKHAGIKSRPSTVMSHSQRPGDEAGRYPQAGKKQGQNSPQGKIDQTWGLFYV